MSIILNLVRGGSTGWGSPPGNYGFTDYQAAGYPGVSLTLPQQLVQELGNPSFINVTVASGTNEMAVEQKNTWPQ